MLRLFVIALLIWALAGPLAGVARADGGGQPPVEIAPQVAENCSSDVDGEAADPESCEPTAENGGSSVTEAEALATGDDGPAAESSQPPSETEPPIPPVGTDDQASQSDNETAVELDQIPDSAVQEETVPQTTTEDDQAIQDSETSDVQTDADAPAQESTIGDQELLVPDPYFFVGGVKHSYLPSGGDCLGAANCVVSTTPIQVALDAIAEGLTPDDGTLYIEGGRFEEDIIIGDFFGLTLQGSANGEPTTLAGSVSIIKSQSISLQDFVFLEDILVEDATDVSIKGSDQDDQIAVTITGSSQVEIQAGGGDDKVTVHGNKGKANVDGGAGNDILTVDFISQDNPPGLDLNYDGGPGFDVLAVQGGTFDSVSYAPIDPSSGSIVLDASQVVYTNIEPISDLSAAADATFNGTSNDDTIAVVDGSIVTDATNCPTGCQTIEIQSPQFENITFANKTNVTLDAGQGDDTITLNITKLAAGLSSLTVKGGEPTGLGSLSVDADTITVSGTIALPGGDFNLSAETITISPNTMISTRMLAAGSSDYENAASIGNSGAATFKGKNITIGSNAKLLAHVEDGSSFTAGDLSLSVYENAGLDLSFYNKDVSDVSITVSDGAVLRGGKVSLSSSVDHSRVLQYTGDDSNVVLNDLAGFVKSLSFFAGIAYSSISSIIEIKPNAKIYAASFTAAAGGVGSAQSEPSGLGISVALAYVENRTKVIVGGQIHTTGDAYLNAGVDNTALALADTSALQGGAAAIAINIVDSEATVHITDDAKLQIGGNLTIQANTVNRTYTQATSSADENGLLGIAAAIGDDESVTNALVDGIVEVGKDLAINAHHTTKSIARPILVIPKDEGGVNAEAGVAVGGDETAKWLERVRLGTGALDGTDWKPSLQGTSAAATGVLTNFLQGTVIAFLKDKMPKSSGTPPFQLAAAVAVTSDIKRTTARIGDGNTDGDGKSGEVTAGGLLTIQSKIENRPSISAVSSVEKGTDSTDVQGTKFAGSAAVTIGLYTNDAKAYINEYAQVDAKKTLMVQSLALNDLTLMDVGRKIKKDLLGTFSLTPKYLSTAGAVKVGDEDTVKVEKGHTAGGIEGDLYQYVGTSPNSIIDLAKEDFSNPGNWKHLGSPSYYTATQFVGNIYGYLNDDVAGIFSDSVTQATATDAQTVSMAFAVAVIDLDHTSQAYIADNARVNQKSAFRSGEQQVEVRAKSVNEFLQFIGNIQLPTAGLDAAKFEFSPSAGGFGTSGGKGAVGVVVLVIDYDNKVLAKIGDGARVYADSLNVDADNEVMSLLIGASGGEAGQVGFNGVVFVQSITNTTYAQIENGAVVTVGSQLAADHWGQVQSGTTTTVKLASDASVNDDEYKGQYIQLKTADGVVQTKKILAYDGTTKVATIEAVPTAPTSSTEYRILNAASAALLVDASDRTDVATLAGGVAVSKNIGIGATLSIQNLTRDTQAIIGNRVNDANETDAATGSITVGGDMQVSAENTGFLGGFSLAAAVKKKSTDVAANDPLDGATLSTLFGDKPSTDMAGKSGASIAGDVAIKTVSDAVRAYIRDAGPITVSGKAVKLLAKNGTKFLSLSGAVAISLSDPGKKSAGIAGSFSQNNVTFTTETFVRNTTITAASLTQDAGTTGWVVAASAGGSGATGTNSYAIAGSVSLNGINHTTRANSENANLTLSGALTQTATNSSTMTAIGGAFSLGGKVGLGASVALNTIDDVTEAKILSSSLRVGGDMALKADNRSRITAVTVSVGASQSTGAAGTVSINLIDNTIEAAIENTTNLIAAAAASVLAQDAASIYSFAGALGIGLKKSGLGAAFAWNEITSAVRAKIENSTLPGSSVSVKAEVKDAEIWTLSVGAAGAKNTAIAGSVSVNAITNTIDAHISNGSDVDASGDVTVAAKDASLIKSLAGQVAISISSSAIGAAVGVNMIGNTVKAYIDDSNVDTTAGGNIKVSADEAATIHSISAGGSGGNNFTLGGSVSVNTLTNSSKAYLTGSKPVNADGTLAISASDDTDAWALAGNISVSIGGTAIGISNVTTVTNNTVEAYLGSDMVVSAKGNGNGLAVYTGKKSDDNLTTETVKGLAVVAVSFEDIDSFAVGGSGGGGTGVAGSASVSVLNETTKAYLDSGAQVNVNNAGANDAQDVLVRASDDTNLTGVAGGVGLGMSGGVGAGIDVAVVSKTTQAKIGAGAVVKARRNVIVEAISKEEVVSVSGTIGIGQSAGIAGSVDVSVYTLTTEAFIEGSKVVNGSQLNGARVTADGSVKAAAEDNTEIDMIAGAIGGGLSAGISAAISVPIVTKTIRAYIGKGAVVNGLAKNQDGIRVKTGEFIETLIPDPLGVIDDKDQGKVPGLQTTGDANNSGYSSKRIVTSGEVVGFKGVAVSAVNQDDVAAWSAGLGIAAEGAGVQFSTTVNVMTIDTLAYIDENALVNQADGANSDQSVMVVAGNDYSFKGFSGGVSGAGEGAAVTPAVFVGVIDTTTKAYIGKSAKVTAQDDIVITAYAAEDILSLAVAIAGAGIGGGVAGAIVVIDIDATTYAYVDENAIVKAGGNIRISAADSSEIDAIIGSLGFAGLGGGVGASVGVSSLTKDTRAYVAANASVTALGKSAANLKPYNGDFDAAWQLKRNNDVHGLVIEAYSSEDIWTLLIAGAAGIIGGGVAGTVEVLSVDSDTLAYIAAGAVINGENSGASDQQDVYVNSANAFTLFAILGGLGVGMGGVAGAVDVLTLRNDTIYRRDCKRPS
ncbi:MAG: hypothetical protein GXP40_02800 [Chloroflexi bacterium]|nr:hypothetical protein [Chloroflexota bacterium]